MKKLFKAGLLSLAVLSMSAAAPVYARSKPDGERGYALGCLIGWWVFGLTETCKELQR